jgi:hypothetical protein
MAALTIAACGFAFAAVCYGVHKLSAAWNERRLCRLDLHRAGVINGRMV